MFVAVYTNRVKRYCEDEFFNALFNNVHKDFVHVVDNSDDGGQYAKHLQDRFGITNITHLDIQGEPKFHKKVCESVNYLREQFIQSDELYFTIVESDVILNNSNILNKLIENMYDMPINIGIIGAIYYDGFHNFNLIGMHETPHVLSGCSIYKRELIEKYPFRYDINYLAPFPDAWICADSIHEYKFFNNHDLKCDHRHAPDGTRVVN
jgi:hypothetical protein